jgi:hypothetical protein
LMTSHEFAEGVAITVDVTAKQFRVVDQSVGWTKRHRVVTPVPPPRQCRPGSRRLR